MTRGPVCDYGYLDDGSCDGVYVDGVCDQCGRPSPVAAATAATMLLESDDPVVVEFLWN